MSYDIRLKDPVSGETLELPHQHMMAGGTMHAEMVDGRLVPAPTTDAWLNVTYNYGCYYRETFPENGIREIYGKSGAESISILDAMIDTIRNHYQKDGEWVTTKHSKRVYYDLNGNEIEDWLDAVLNERPYTTEDIEYDLCECPNDDYWEATAANALQPLYQLRAMAQLRPDGIWDGD